jgi:hypothetical protein
MSSERTFILLFITGISCIQTENSIQIDYLFQIYELLSGHLIITIVFDTPLWAVVMDSAQYFMFVGGEDGNIYETRLYERPLNLSQKDNSPKFVGHELAFILLIIVSFIDNYRLNSYLDLRSLVFLYQLMV